MTPATSQGAADRGSAGATATTLLCLAAVVAPLALGGTQPLAIAGLTLVMAVVICLGAVALRPGLMPLVVPVACLLLPLLQLVPLPDRLLFSLAPVSAGAWKVAQVGVPAARGRISIDPAETAAAARRAFLAVGTVSAVAGLALRPPWRNWLVAAMALSGTVIWMLGLAFPVKLHSFLLLGGISFKGPLMPGRTPLEPPPATAGFGFPEMVSVAGQRYAADSWVVGDGFGPYLVTNHFAGALTLTIPFLVAGWLVASRGRLSAWLRHGVAAAVFVGAAATLGVLVRSRAGTASFVLAALVFACCAAPAGWLRRCLAAVTLTLVFVVAGFTVMLFGSFHGVASLLPADFQPRVAELLADSRVEASRVAMRMFLASPLLGTGLGTYGDLQPVMLRDGSPLYFAHNEYAQLLAEAGVTGAAMAMLLLALLAKSAVAFWRNAGNDDRTLGAGAWAAVAGILVHSFFDWNLRVPANAFFTCIASGLAIAGGAQAAYDDAPERSWGRTRAACTAALVLAVIVAAVFQFRDTVSERTQRGLRTAIVAARLHAADPNSASPQAALEAAVVAGERMAKWDPGDAQLAVHLGQAYLHLAAMPLPIDEADAALCSATTWFRRARLLCAACRGLAEPEGVPGTP